MLQDILWKAKIHPKRKINTLNDDKLCVIILVNDNSKYLIGAIDVRHYQNEYLSHMMEILVMKLEQVNVKKDMQHKC